jgi:hypothetical protein
MHAKESIPAGAPMFGKKKIPTPITVAVDNNIQTRKNRRARYVSSAVISVMVFLCLDEN